MSQKPYITKSAGCALNVVKWFCSLHTCNANVGVTVTECTCFSGYLPMTTMVRVAQVWFSLRYARLDHAKWGRVGSIGG